MIDPSAVNDILSAIVGGVEPEIGPEGEILGNLDDLLTPGPLAPPVVGMEVTHKAMAGWLADMLDGLRRLGEETGLRVVLVTCDDRPLHGQGEMRRSHFFRDGRVRSSIGDAGRYYAHQRYRIERVVKTTYKAGYTETTHTENGETIIEEYDPQENHEYVADKVVVIKDEAEGLPGRLVYERIRGVAC